MSEIEKNRDKYSIPIKITRILRYFFYIINVFFFSLSTRALNFRYIWIEIWWCWQKKKKIEWMSEVLFSLVLNIFWIFLFPRNQDQFFTAVSFPFFSWFFLVFSKPSMVGRKQALKFIIEESREAWLLVYCTSHLVFSITFLIDKKIYKRNVYVHGQLNLFVVYL